MLFSLVRLTGGELEFVVVGGMWLSWLVGWLVAKPVPDLGNEDSILCCDEGWFDAEAVGCRWFSSKTCR